MMAARFDVVSARNSAFLTFLAESPLSNVPGYAATRCSHRSVTSSGRSLRKNAQGRTEAHLASDQHAQVHRLMFVTRHRSEFNQEAERR